jgi:hypothetical protein
MLILLADEDPRGGTEMIDTKDLLRLAKRMEKEKRRRMEFDSAMSAEFAGLGRKPKRLSAGKRIAAATRRAKTRRVLSPARLAALRKNIKKAQAARWKQ